MRVGNLVAKMPLWTAVSPASHHNRKAMTLMSRSARRIARRLTPFVTFCFLTTQILTPALAAIRGPGGNPITESVASFASMAAASNVTSRTDNHGSITNFLCGGAKQLTSESRTVVSPYSITYTFDGNGNRLTRVLGGVTENYSYGLNDQLLTAGSKSYQYDNNGNCTSITSGGQTTSLTYSYENRVTRIDYPGGSNNTFQYNGLGLRTRKVDSAGTFNYVCDGTNPASPVLSDSAAIYTPGESERRAGVSKFYHGDALSSTRGITSSTQTATDSALYDGFGMTVSRTGTTPTPFGFIGREQYQTDADSGLQLLGHRYLDSATGRFLSQDPIGYGNNWYVYVDNNPLDSIDPEGLQARTPPRTPRPRNRGSSGGGLSGGFGRRSGNPRISLFDQNRYDKYGRPYPNQQGPIFTRPLPPGTRRRSPEEVVDILGLPREGDHRYRPPQWWTPSQPLPRGPGGRGYVDQAGNVWVRGPNHHFPAQRDPRDGGPLLWEWDVQIPNGGHLNVSPHGQVR